MKRVNILKEIINDKEYNKIVKDILDNEKFKKIKEEKHHGINRYDHSLKVSYKSYLYAKKYNLDYVSVARAGLLHDFFINNDLTKKEQKVSAFVHPYKSLENSTKYFDLNKKEENIIISHMFPTIPHKIPKYKESYIVSIIDKIIATKEFYQSYGKTKIKKFANIYMILIALIRK